MKIKKVYLGQQQIYPEVTHYAYYPLTVDAKDYSGNDRHLTADNSITYGSDGAVLPNSNHSGLVPPFSLTTNGNWTISLWQRCKSKPANNDRRGTDLYFGSTSRRLISGFNDNGILWHRYGSTESTKICQQSFTTNTWYKTDYVFENSSVKVYVNGELKATKTSLGSYTTTYIRRGNEYNLGADRHFYGNMKDLIIEDKSRTAEEVADYYNQTKSLYGIS